MTPNIYHETQIGQMCAVHAVNTLLQDKVFTPNDLASIGSHLDELEKSLIKPSGGETSTDKQSDQSDQSNLDSNGNFSIQVITVALALRGLELLPFHSSDSRAASARQSTYDQQAFICHKNNHWFTVRKFGSQWYNLDSLLPQPVELSHNQVHLSLFDTRKKIERFTGIFIVIGNLVNATRAD